MAMRIDQTWQDELSRSVDDRVVRALRPYTADMGDPVSFYGDQRIRDRVASRTVDQRTVLDQQPRRGIGHDSRLPIRATARLGHSRLDRQYGARDRRSTRELT